MGSIPAPVLRALSVAQCYHSCRLAKRGIAHYIQHERDSRLQNIGRLESATKLGELLGLLSFIMDMKGHWTPAQRSQQLKGGMMQLLPSPLHIIPADLYTLCGKAKNLSQYTYIEPSDVSCARKYQYSPASCNTNSWCCLTHRRARHVRSLFYPDRPAQPTAVLLNSHLLCIYIQPPYDHVLHRCAEGPGRKDIIWPREMF